MREPRAARLRAPRRAPRASATSAALLALAVGRLDDARVADGSAAAARLVDVVHVSYAGCGTPASAKRSRWRSFDVARTAVSGESGCGSPSRAATRAAIATGPVDARAR